MLFILDMVKIIHKRKAKDVANYLLGAQEDECHEIVVLPPTNVDEETDNDDIDDENVGEAEVNGDLAGEFELVVQDDDFVEEEEHNFAPRWEKDTCQNDFIKVPFDLNLENIFNRCANMNDIDFFELFFDQFMLEHILQESIVYAGQKNDHNFTLTLDDLKSFLGILMFSGYHQLPQQTHYFTQSEDLGIPLVYNHMTRDRFLTIKKYLHFNDNNNINVLSPKSFKIKPIMDMANVNFKKFGFFHEKISVDEQIVKYFGRNSIKQFIRNKPIRFGFKNCYHIDLYAGKDANRDTNVARGRGSMSFAYDHNSKTQIVKWFDNKCVVLGSNCFDASEGGIAKRRKKNEGIIEVPMPSMVREYNVGMGVWTY